MCFAVFTLCSHLCWLYCSSCDVWSQPLRGEDRTNDVLQMQSAKHRWGAPVSARQSGCHDPLGSSLQKTCSNLSGADLCLRQSLSIGLGCAATNMTAPWLLPSAKSKDQVWSGCTRLVLPVANRLGSLQDGATFCGAVFWTLKQISWQAQCFERRASKCSNQS